jgi:hypothetical protein
MTRQGGAKACTIEHYQNESTPWTINPQLGDLTNQCLDQLFEAHFFAF